MIELLQQMRSNGFEPGEAAVLDGTVKRFGRGGKKDNAWLIGWRNFSVSTGDPYEVAIYGDWRTREEYIFKPGRKLSKDDKAAVDRQIDEARKRSEEAKAARQLEASSKAEKRWATAGEVFESPYFERKKISELHGARTSNAEGGRAIRVPMRDVSGKLWGVQTILHDGTKFFMTGQMVKGCFHRIGQDDDEFVVCEGFATGASLRQATGKTVVVAFDSGNLAPVCLALRAKYPDAKITVARDDDRFKEKNAGLEGAEKAAKISGAAIVSPVFGSDEGEPTDFNDLHVREGLDAVRACFAEPKAPDDGFIPLGFNKGIHFYYSIRAKDVIECTSYSEVQMLSLAPPEYWYAHYPSKVGINWQTAKSNLIALTQAIGPFDPSRLRGTGVWLDRGRTVVNTGHGLVVDGVRMPLQNIDSWHLYVQTINRMPPLHERPLSTDECRPLLDACDLLNWKDQKSALYLAGWIAVARIAGALPVRPHVWLTGGAGTGKSTAMSRLIAPALGCRKGKKYVQGGSTEAGIRQEVQSSSLPVIFDEFETTNEGSRERVQALVELLRQSWSSTDGVVVKGTVHGHAQQYQLCFAALVSSVRIQLDNDADRSRFSVLELAPHGGTGDKWPQLREALKLIDEEFGERLFARAVKMATVVGKSQAIIEDVLAESMGQRFAQQHSTLLAGWFMLRQDFPVTAEQARAAVADMNLEDERDDQALTDERECLEWLLKWKMTLRCPLNGAPIEMTVEKIVHEGGLAERGQLKLYGIIVENHAIFVANRNPELAKHFARTRWVEWGRSLQRLPGAQKAKPKWFGEAGASRAVMIPRTAL